MGRSEFYFSSDVRDQIARIRHDIDSRGLWQMSLVDASALSRLSIANRTSDFRTEDIERMWSLGLLQADIVRSDSALGDPSLILMTTDPDGFVYADRRVVVGRASGYADAFGSVDHKSPGIQLAFHPFRCFTLYHLHRVFRLNILSLQVLYRADAFHRLTDWHVDVLNQWSGGDEAVKTLQYWNDVASLCSVAEPPVHQLIFSRVRHAGVMSFEETAAALATVGATVHALLRELGERALTFHWQELCEAAECLDANKSVHLVLRLMDADERDRLKGHIGGAMLLIHMAESLRRNMERTFEREFPEEDEGGFGHVFKSAKIQLHGSARVLDSRVHSNQCLRHLGLDYGIRVRAYVEGVTEYGALQAEFQENSAVQIVNLKGQFVERQGKGVAFRESLRNDLKSKTFSLILLDADSDDNVRVVRQAARDDEICGMFYLCDPDVEFANFELRELCEIVVHVAAAGGDHALSVDQLVAEAAGAHDARTLMKCIERARPGGAPVSKGLKWGQALAQYAMEHPLGEFGGKQDRVINRLIRTLHQCVTFTYESTKREYRVNPETGELERRGSALP